DVNAWGSGFVLALNKKWSTPEQQYRRLGKKSLVLGNVQFVPVKNNIIVANMIAQRDIKPNSEGVPPIRYAALDVCLQKVARMAKSMNTSVHMPRIGCGLAGGYWELIEVIIKKQLVDKGVEVYVYDFN
ncbi:MAG: Appr-1-p processing protein, partial [bacterium]